MCDSNDISMAQIIFTQGLIRSKFTSIWHPLVSKYRQMSLFYTLGPGSIWSCVKDDVKSWDRKLCKIKSICQYLYGLVDYTTNRCGIISQKTRGRLTCCLPLDSAASPRPASAGFPVNAQKKPRRRFNARKTRVATALRGAAHRPRVPRVAPVTSSSNAQGVDKRPRQGSRTPSWKPRRTRHCHEDCPSAFR